MKVLIVLCSVLVYSQALIGHVCQDNTQCGAGECCQILNPFPIMSKRQLVVLERPTSGTCQHYQKLGDGCDVFQHMNGYCSCEPGTECRGFEVKNVDQSVGRRSMIAPHPGFHWVYNCSAVTAP